MADTSTSTASTTASPDLFNSSILDLPDDELAKYGSFEALQAAHPGLAAAGEPGAGTAGAADAGAGEDDPDAQGHQGGEGATAEGAAAEGAAGDAATAGAEAGKGGSAQTLNPPSQEGQGTQGKLATAAQEPAKKAGEGEPAPGSKEGAKAPESPAQVIDYKAAYERLTAPFTANGKQMSVANVDEAIQLMQMGAGYAKKMGQLKPQLAIVKMLERANLLDESKVSFLIDLSRKDQGAINKLLKEGNVDPMGLDPEKAGEYKPGAHAVDEREIALEQVMDEIQDTPTFARTVKIVQGWDARSRDAIANEPVIMKTINAHVAAGVFDIISAELDKREALGQLAGVPFLAAYRQIGDEIQARGGFNHLAPKQGQAQSQGQGTPPTTPVEITPKPSAAEQEEEARRNAKRRAAAPSRPGAPAAPAPKVNPLAMSDDEFAAYMKSQGGR